MAGFYNEALSWLLLLLIIFAPLAFGSVEFWSIALVEAAAFALVFVWFLKMLADKKLEFIPTSLAPFISVFILLIIFSLIPFPKNTLALISPNTKKIYDLLIPRITSTYNSATLSLCANATRMELYKVLAFAAVFFVTVNSFNRRRQLDRLIRTLVFFGFFLSVFAILQRYTWNGKIYWMRPISEQVMPFGPFINENHFAAYIGMIIPFCIGAVFLDASGERRYFFAFAAIVMIAGLFLSASRAGIASFAFSLGLTAILVRARTFFKGKVKTFALLILCAIVFISVFGLPIIADRFGEFFQSPRSEARFVIWKDTLNLIKDFPVFGTGVATFVDILPAYKTYPGQINFAHAFNEYLEVFAEMGILGFVVFMTAIFVFFKNTFYKFLLSQTSQLKRHDPFVVVYGSACMASFLMIGFHNMLSFNLHVPAIGLTAVFLAALSFNITRSRFSEKREDILPQSRSFGISNNFLLILAYIIVISTFVLSSTAIAKSYLDSRKPKGETSKAIDKQQEHKEAIRANPARASNWFEFGISAKDEQLLETALSLDPTNSKYHHKFARYYAFYSKPPNTTKALREYRRAIELSGGLTLQEEVLEEVSNNISDEIEVLRAAIPDTPQAGMRLVYFLIDDKGDEEALAELDRVFKLARDTADTESEAAAFNIRGTIYQRQKDFNRAIEMFEKAVELDSEEPWYFCNLGWIHLKLNNFHQSERAFRKALAVNLKYGLAHFRLGVLYEQHDLLKRAQHQYEKVLMLPLESVRRELRLEARKSLKRVKNKLLMQ